MTTTDEALFAAYAAALSTVEPFAIVRDAREDRYLAIDGATGQPLPHATFPTESAAAEAWRLAMARRCADEAHAFIHHLRTVQEWGGLTPPEVPITQPADRPDDFNTPSVGGGADY
jgi:hypothetical protein